MLLGTRVSVELRVFLTAAVIIDDLVAIGVIAVFYTEAINPHYLIASVIVSGLLVALNRGGIYGPLPYAVLGVVLWVCLKIGRQNSDHRWNNWHSNLVAASRRKRVRVADSLCSLAGDVTTLPKICRQALHSLKPCVRCDIKTVNARSLMRPCERSTSFLL